MQISPKEFEDGVRSLFNDHLPWDVTAVFEDFGNFVGFQMEIEDIGLVSKPFKIEREDMIKDNIEKFAWLFVAPIIETGGE